MSENEQEHRAQYAEIWKTIPVDGTVVDIPEGATEQGAAQSGTLPEDLTPEEVNQILSEVTPHDE
jgi:hypothetical protein